MKPGTLSSSGVPNWRTGIENKLLRLMPTKGRASSLLVAVHDPLVGPVVVHDGVCSVELRPGREVLGDHSMRT